MMALKLQYSEGYKHRFAHSVHLVNRNDAMIGAVIGSMIFLWLIVLVVMADLRAWFYHSSQTVRNTDGMMKRLRTMAEKDYLSTSVMPSSVVFNLTNSYAALRNMDFYSSLSKRSKSSEQRKSVSRGHDTSTAVGTHMGLGRDSNGGDFLDFRAGSIGRLVNSVNRRASSAMYPSDHTHGVGGGGDLNSQQQHLANNNLAQNNNSTATAAGIIGNTAASDTTALGGPNGISSTSSAYGVGATNTAGRANGTINSTTGGPSALFCGGGEHSSTTITTNTTILTSLKSASIDKYGSQQHHSSSGDHNNSATTATSDSSPAMVSTLSRALMRSSSKRGIPSENALPPIQRKASSSFSLSIFSTGGSSSKYNKSARIAAASTSRDLAYAMPSSHDIELGQMREEGNEDDEEEEECRGHGGGDDDRLGRR
jgi:hypothetical protein